MSRLTARLTNLEKRHKPPKEMLGAYEVHCVGGLGKIKGELVRSTRIACSRPLPCLAGCGE